MLEPSGVLQRDAVDPAVRRKQQLGKQDAVPNFSTGLASGIDQRRSSTVRRGAKRHSTPCSGLMATRIASLP